MKFLISREHVFFIKIWDGFYSPQFFSFLTMVIFRDYTSVTFGWVTQQWDNPWSKYFPIGNAQMNVNPKFNSVENWKVCITMKKKKKIISAFSIYLFWWLERNFGHVATAVTQWCSVKKQFLNNSENLRKKKVQKSSILIRSRSLIIYEIPASGCFWFCSILTNRNKVNIRKMP